VDDNVYIKCKLCTTLEQRSFLEGDMMMYLLKMLCISVVTGSDHILSRSSGSDPFLKISGSDPNWIMLRAKFKLDDAMHVATLSWATPT